MGPFQHQQSSGPATMAGVLLLLLLPILAAGGVEGKKWKKCSGGEVFKTEEGSVDSDSLKLNQKCPDVLFLLATTKETTFTCPELKLESGMCLKVSWLKPKGRPKGLRERGSSDGARRNSSEEKERPWSYQWASKRFGRQGNLRKKCKGKKCKSKAVVITFCQTNSITEFEFPANAKV